MHGYAAYSRNARHAQSDRETEYRLLGQVTGALLHAQTKLAASDTRSRVEATKAKVDALLWNREVWSTLKLDLLSPQNTLPDELKGSLISLAIWVERETGTLLSGGDNDLQALIDVNKTIMEGLRPTHGAAAPAGA